MLAIVIGRDETFGGVVMKLATRYEITPIDGRIRITNASTGDFITWREIRMATAEKMKEEIPIDTYKKYYAEPRLFAWHKQQKIIVEIIDFDKEADSLEIHIVPTGNICSGYPNVNKFNFRHIRVDSLRNCSAEDQKVELATLGFYKKNQSRVYLSCIHCGQSNISVEGSTQMTISKHIRVSPNCFLRKRSSEESLRVLMRRNQEKDGTTIHLIKINRDLIRLNNIQKIMHESARLKDDNHDRIAETKSHEPLCVICLEKKAVVLQVPCFHMVLCKSCFQKQNTERGNEEDDLELGNYKPCTMCRHPINIVTTIFS